MFENSIVFLLWVMTTYLVSSIVLGFMDAYRYIDSKARTNFLKHLDRIIHRVRVEKVNDVYYWYDHDDGEFLAQGTSDEEIINGLKSRFPTHIFYLPTNHFLSQKTNWEPRLQHVEKIDQ